MRWCLEWEGVESVWKRVAKKQDVEKNTGQTHEVDGLRIALFNSGGKYYAMDDKCVHRGASLGEGSLERDRVTCPWHAWEFNVKTGKCYTMDEAAQKTYPVKVEGDNVWVDC